MKKALILIILFAVCKQVSAQTATPVNSSYVATSYIDVYPYSSVPKDKVDKSIHFNLNGAQFTVIKTIDSAGTNLGYVILPWKYNDKDSSKVNFYKNVIDSAHVRIKKIIAQKDSIKAKEVELKTLATSLHKDSITIDKLEKTAEAANKDLDVKREKLYNLLVRIDAKNAIILPAQNIAPVKNKLNTFTSIRSQMLSQFADEDEEDKTALINAALVVPFNKNIYFNRYSSDYASAKNKAENTKRQSADAKGELDKKLAASKTVIQELSKLKASNSQQSPQGNLYDETGYKKTKRQINDPLDASPNVGNQAALYEELAFVDSWANGWLFFMSAKDFADRCVPMHTRGKDFTWGFLTLPVKMRFDNDKGGRFDFEQNLNFGITFGIKQQFAKKSDMSVNYLAGLSVVSVPLSDGNSSTALSPSLGAMFQYDKFQIGAFLGLDFAGSQSKIFNYQGKPWLGIAIGVSLFGEHKTEAPKNQSQ